MGSAPLPSPEPARWITFSPECQVRQVPLGGASGLPFREADVRCAGIDSLKGPFLAGTDRSSSHLVWLILSGKALLSSGKTKHAVAPGQLIISPAEHPHWIQIPPSPSPTVAAWFHLNPTSYWASLEGRPPRVVSSLQGGTLGSLLDLHIRETQQDDFLSDALASRYAEAALLLLRRELMRAVSTVPPSARASEKLLQTLLASVSNDVSASWTVAGMAARLGISAGHLHRLCLRHWGIGPMHMVRRLRIEKAMALLIRTPLTVDAIAERVGYESPFAFSDAFLRHTALRPGAFRRKNPS